MHRPTRLAVQPTQVAIGILATLAATPIAATVPFSAEQVLAPRGGGPFSLVRQAWRLVSDGCGDGRRRGEEGEAAR